MVCLKSDTVLSDGGTQKLRPWCHLASWRTESSYWRHVTIDNAIGYGLDGPGIESRWGERDFPHPSRPALGPTQPPIQWLPGLSRGVKQPGRGV